MNRKEIEEMLRSAEEEKASELMKQRKLDFKREQRRTGIAMYTVLACVVLFTVVTVATAVVGMVKFTIWIWTV